MLAALAAAFALVCGLLAATLAVPAASASKPRVSNMVIRSMTIDPQTMVASAKGAVTCTGTRRAYLWVEVHQGAGPIRTGYAYGQRHIDCDGRKRFSIKLTTARGRLLPGDAKVKAFAEVWTPQAHDFARFSGVVPIKFIVPKDQ